MSITHTAFATTTASHAGADNGITILRQVTEDGVLRESDEVATLTAGTELDDSDGDLDADAATAAVARLGFTPAGAGWIRSGDQWAMQVEPA